MSASLSDQVKQTFTHASLVHEASKNLGPTGWEAFQEIRRRHDSARRYTERLYREEYKTRVEQVHSDLLGRRAAKTRDFKPRFGSADLFDKEALHRQAHRLVQQQHQNDLVKVDRSEAKEISELLNRSEQKQSNQKDTYNNDNRGEKDRGNNIEKQNAFHIRQRSR